PLYELRSEAVRCLGTMQVKQAIPELWRIVRERTLGDKVRASAIASLVLLKNDLKKEDILNLSKSERSGFRELAVAVIEHNESNEYADCLFRLLEDPSRDVRQSAIHALVTLRYHGNLQIDSLNKISPLLKDESEETA